VHHHQAPHTRSNLDFKVVLTGRARSAYTGLIRIASDAPSSEAYQENRNLLLTEGTKADSIPELEILTDEVMCTHGATVGSLDPDHLFYLASRGIPRREAARMIVGGFFEPTLKRLPEDLRERIQAHVEAGLTTI
jgi:Fe-S cluster assembly protein SufD